MAVHGALPNPPDCAVSPAYQRPWRTPRPCAPPGRPALATFHSPHPGTRRRAKASLLLACWYQRSLSRYLWQLNRYTLRSSSTRATYSRPSAADTNGSLPRPPLAPVSRVTSFTPFQHKSHVSGAPIIQTNTTRDKTSCRQGLADDPNRDDNWNCRSLPVTAMAPCWRVAVVFRVRDSVGIPAAYGAGLARAGLDLCIRRAICTICDGTCTQRRCMA